MTEPTKQQTTKYELQHAAPAHLDILSAPGWELAQRVGKAFAASTLVPAQYQGSLANVIVALEMASRMKASPLMVMQNLYIVHGNPGWSSKFLIASFNQCGRFSAMRFKFNERRDECRAWAIERETGEVIEGPAVSVEMARAEGWSSKNGSKWKTMPELMLMYRAAAFLVRTYAPEISMGLPSEDELRDMDSGARAALPADPVGLSAVRKVLDERKAGAEDVEPVSRPDIGVIAEQIEQATNAETAQLLIDEVRDQLTPDEIAELTLIWTQAWTELKDGK